MPGDKRQRLTYKDAGVDIEAGARAVELMKETVKKTHDENVLAELGTFGAMFRVPNRQNIIAVSSIDGVGTRIKTAIMADRHETSGQALVAHCINDILVQGAQAAFFLDYYAAAKLLPEHAARVVSGAAEECTKHGVALIGGETAEMKGFYTEGIYDFVGAIVGFVNESQIITGSKIEHGDVVIGLASNGLHTNGYTMVNELVFEMEGLTINDNFPWGVSVADELTKPHRCYAKAVLPLMQWGFCESPIKGAAHITGGGLPGNLVRPLPEGCRAFLDPTSWTILPIFEWIKEKGNVPTTDWRRTFNLGIGLTLITRQADADFVIKSLEEEEETAYIIGEIREDEKGVEFLD